MIICADFDRTIYFPEDEAKTQANLSALQEWRKRNNVSVLATNRSLLSLERTLSNWHEYFDYLVLDGGSRIFNREAKLLWSNVFKSSVVQQLLDAAKNFVPQPKISFYNLAENDFQFTPTSAITKICFRFHTGEEAAAFLLKLVNIDVDTFPYLYNANFQWCPDDVFKGYYANIEAVPSTTNKANAIQELVKIARFSSSNITTVGDNLNDEKMLISFHGYAVKDSKISSLYPNLPTTPSVSDLIERLL